MTNANKEFRDLYHTAYVYAPAATSTRSFQTGDRVVYQRQDHDGQPLATVQGLIESLTRTTCVIEDHHTGDLVAAALRRVRPV